MKVTLFFFWTLIISCCWTCSRAFLAAAPSSSSSSRQQQRRQFDSTTTSTTTTCLFAEESNGVPQYDKLHAVLREAEPVAEGSVMLHIDIATQQQQQQQEEEQQQQPDMQAAFAALAYQPGHVLALEVQHYEDGTRTTPLSDYNQKVADSNDGWMRGPYTVSRATATSMDILIRLVGNKSHELATAQPGRALKFGGKFKVPIVEGILAVAGAASATTSSKDDDNDNNDNDDDDNYRNPTQRVVLISSGVGVGPCVGAIEQMLLQDDTFAEKQIHLLASYRTAPEVVYRDYLNELAAQYPTRFQWNAIVTSEMGRLSASRENLRLLTEPITTTTNNNVGACCSVTETHYHVIGNGQLVNEWKAGLAQAGVPDERVTDESYFNHKAKVNADAVQNIAKCVSTAAVATKKTRVA